MRLITYQSDSGPRTAGLRGNQAVDLHRADPTLPSCIKALLALGSAALPRVRLAVEKGTAVAVDSLVRLPPIPSPEKIICVGLNYADHAKESGLPIPAEPVIFCKLPTAASCHGRPIVVPRVSAEVDYEAELVLVIGRGGRRIPVEQAREHIAAYCCGNDVSARDWQLRKPGGQWLLGKSFDTFAPFGPELVTADELAEPGALAIETRLNGRVVQQSSTRQLIFPVERLVSYVSEVCTLSPGDVLFTGTPPGVGFARTPPLYLQPGDVVEVEIEKLGILRNPVIAEGSGQ